MYECDRVVDRGRAERLYIFRERLDYHIEKWKRRDIKKVHGDIITRVFHLLPIHAPFLLHLTHSQGQAE